MWIVVALSGVTCGGKTTLAKKLQKNLLHSRILHQDDYFFRDDTSMLEMLPNTDHYIYDKITALDMEKMHKDMTDIISSDVSMPNSSERPVLILDGFLMLNYGPIVDSCHLKYQLNLAKDECLRRRKMKPYYHQEVPEYFDLCVWPQYLLHNEEVKSMCDVTFLDGMANDSCEKILKDIRDKCVS